MLIAGPRHLRAGQLDCHDQLAFLARPRVPCRQGTAGQPLMRRLASVVRPYLS
jgi:hypothetical protein